MKHSGQSGFTVVEIFMVITLLTVVTALTVIPVQRLLEAMHYRPVEHVLLSAVRQAHLRARQYNEMVVLNYVSESNLLRLCTVDGACLDEFPLGDSGRDEGDLAPLQLHRLLPEDPDGEAPAFEQEEDAVESVAFMPTGASTPFAVELTAADGTVRLVLDPFSSEPVLREEEGERL